MSKPIKSWGQIGGFQSLSKSWGEPADTWPFWPLYEKEGDYSEVTYTGPDCDIMQKADCFHTHWSQSCPPCKIDYYQLSFTTGQPQATLVVKHGFANKLPCESCCRYLDWRIFK